MPDHQGRQDFPEVADEKINIGTFNEWAPLGVSDIYSPKEEPKLRDQVMLDQAAMLKEIVSMIESFSGKKADKKVEDPYKGSSIKKATGWTMDKQNPEGQSEGFGNDAYYKPPSKRELATGHASMKGEKSEWDTHGKPKTSGVNKQESEKSKNVEKGIGDVARKLTGQKPKEAATSTPQSLDAISRDPKTQEAFSTAGKMTQGMSLDSSSVDKSKAQASFEMCAKCGDKLEKGGGCPPCDEKETLTKAIVKSIDNYLR